MSFLRKLLSFWWIFLIGALIGGFFYWRNVQAKTAEIETKSYTVVRQDLSDYLTVSGAIDASEKATLRFQTSGKLAWVGVKEGDFVKKFQVVASLDQSDLKNRMNQLLNTYMKTRWNFEQAQDDNENWQTDLMSDAEREAIKRVLDKEQYDLNNSVLAVESQNIAVKLMNLWTPIAGLVTHVDTPQSGVNVTPSTASIEVVNPLSIYLSVTADQTEVIKFKVGQKGKILMDAYPEMEITGTVERIGFIPKEGETGTVYEILIKLDRENTDYALKMGMTGDATFVFKELKGVLVVPSSYVEIKDGKKYVNKLMGDKRIPTVVTTGLEMDGQTEITNGLSENDVLYSN